MNKAKHTSAKQRTSAYLIQNINDLVEQHEKLAQNLLMERLSHIKIIKKCKKTIKELERDL